MKQKFEGEALENALAHLDYTNDLAREMSDETPLFSVDEMAEWGAEE